jgi:ferredoxin--NADP+ reductase
MTYDVMRIINKNILTETADTRVVRFEVEAADISRKARPGQFVVLMACPEGERIPLTVVDTDKTKGTITIIFQEVGLTTRLLGELEPGDSLYALVGPLGHATEMKKYGTVIVVGGGVGIAEIYPVAKGFKEAGNRVVSILGARTKDLLILEKEMRSVSDACPVTTDDGSLGKKGFVTAVLQEELGAQAADLVYAVGPIPMMRKVAEVSAGFGVRTIVSLNALMVDGTGMCGCCRVTVAGATKFTCVDGPEFDAAEVDWQELAKRNQIYAEQEKHICRLPVK